MSSEARYLVEVLQQSVAKNGPNKPVTLSHLLNIVQMAERLRISEEELEEKAREQAGNEARTNLYGSDD